jgi:hypothetical protein
VLAAVHRSTEVNADTVRGGSVRWRLGVFAAVAVMLVTLIPQVSLMVARGRDWNGAYAYTDPDELAYSAYLNSLIHGRPRRNNPESPATSARTLQNPENIFSIQFIPPYLVALVARLFGLSASTAFIALMPIMALISSLVLFWLLVTITGDDRTAAIGTMLILLCGVLASENLLAADNHYAVFSFLRRYIPAVPFPFAIVFLAFVWRAFTGKTARAIWWLLAAALTFGMLVYSYFFLWTGVAAWFCCFTALWLVGRQRQRLRIFGLLLSFSILMIIGLIPYFQMLGNRLQSTDTDLGLVLTRAPDLFRFTEIIGLLILAALAWGVRKGKLSWKSPASLFAASCAIAPFLVFNQQILTGRSLQPFHYEQFILNYLILIGVVVADRLLWNFLLRRPVFVTALAVVVGTTLGIKATTTHWRENVMRDEAIPLFKKLDEEVARQQTTGSALFDKTLLSASSQTTCSTLPVFWSLYSYTYGDMSRAEEHERLYQYFYYLGVEPSRLEAILNSGSLFRGAVFGLTRVNSTLTEKFRPISTQEIKDEVQAYSNYSNRFSAAQAKQWPLSYVILVEGRSYDLSNLDKWYKRDNGEKLGTAIIYRVQLRTSAEMNSTAQ